jgi:hypothetical protein
VYGTPNLRMALREVFGTGVYGTPNLRMALREVLRDTTAKG